MMKDAKSLLASCFSFPFFHSDTDLHNVIKRGNILKEVHKQYILYQLFRATKYLHSGNVIHRDQKVSKNMIGFSVRNVSDENAHFINISRPIFCWMPTAGARLPISDWHDLSFRTVMKARRIRS